jgi:Fanconi-associated nuclease 1
VRVRAPPALRSLPSRKSLFSAAHAAGGAPADHATSASGDDDPDAAALHASLPADAAPPDAAAAAAAAALAAADADAVNDADHAHAGASAAPGALTIEELALAHYAAQGWAGSHSESGVWLTLFALLFWDVIFGCVAAPPPPGVFLSAFQHAPLDLGTPAFAAARAGPLAARLARLAAGDAPRLLAASWAAHRGAAAAGVAWRRHTLAQLQAICTGLGGPALEGIMRLIACDYAGWRSGLPDLVLWRGPPAVAAAEAMLVEVKGPRDAMRPGQRAWASALAQAGVRLQVLQYFE